MTKEASGRELRAKLFRLFSNSSREMTFFIVVTFRNYFMIMRVLLTAQPTEHLSLQINNESAGRIISKPTNETEDGIEGERKGERVLIGLQIFRMLSS